MRYPAALILAIVLVTSASLWAHRAINDPRPDPTPLCDCRRIVSVAPSITETLYALGLGDRVVGVSRYCSYPPEVKQKPAIGGYYDPNFEAVMLAKPDLIIMLEEHKQTLPEFERLKLRTLVVSHQSVQGILDSFQSIGRACGKESEGLRMAEDYEARLKRIGERTKGLPRPRVLMALDRTFGRGHLADVYVAGVDDYFDWMIECAGGRNAYSDRGVRNPVVSPERILWLNPDVIIDVVRKEVLAESSKEAIAADWNELARVEAVKHARVLVFDQDYAWVPGPRFVQLVEDMARAIHPEVHWE